MMVRNFIRYCATRGLLFSHVGWIFFKPSYTKLYLIERDDLDEDPGSSVFRWRVARRRSFFRLPDHESPLSRTLAASIFW